VDSIERITCLTSAACVVDFREDNPKKWGVEEELGVIEGGGAIEPVLDLRSHATEREEQAPKGAAKVNQ